MVMPCTLPHGADTTILKINNKVWCVIMKNTFLRMAQLHHHKNSCLYSMKTSLNKRQFLSCQPRVLLDHASITIC